MIIDTFGSLGPNPGRSWTICGNTTATVNHNVIRKPNVYHGNPQWAQQIGTANDASCEWVVGPVDDFSNGGQHQCMYVGCSPPSLSSHMLAESSYSLRSCTHACTLHCFLFALVALFPHFVVALKLTHILSVDAWIACFMGAVALTSIRSRAPPA